MGSSNVQAIAIIQMRLEETNAELVDTNAALVDTNAELVATNAALVDTDAELVATNAALVATNVELIAKIAALKVKLKVADAWDKVNEMAIVASGNAIRLLEQERVCDRTSRTLEIKRACNDPVAYLKGQQTSASNMKLKVSKVRITFAHVYH
jgi:hypothetical protein